MAIIMDRKTPRVVCLPILLTLAWTGCATQDSSTTFHDDLQHYQDVVSQTSYEDVQTEFSCQQPTLPPPQALRPDTEEIEYWPMSLREAVRLALSNAQVMNDLGGTLIQTPERIQTLQDPSIRETDPRFGVAAALSEFDTQFLFSGNFENNNRALNNRFLAGTHDLQQDLHEWEAALVKRAATGTEFSLRHITNYDANNANGNLFPTSWDVWVEGEFRHPLMQGGGIDFNRIAGPNGAPGALNGIVIARINTDISLADLEIGIRNLVSNVENAYWDLYFAYRDLDAKRKARDASLEIWRKLAGSERQRLPGAEADKVAQAREQYYRFEAEVRDALNGVLVDRTVGSGSMVSTSTPGVYATERALRLLLGLPVNDNRLIRPTEEPTRAEVVFDWNTVTSEALSKRVELRRQRLAVERRELELTASRNFLKPRLDAVGRYRWRGFGDRLLNSSYDRPQFDNAWGNLATGDYQEWQLGFEFSVPLGFRQAHAAVRNAELALARERAILNEQERLVIHDLSNQLNELRRAYEVAQVNLNRQIAAKDRLEALKAQEQNIIMVNLSLDAQQRLAKAESDFFRSLTAYAKAIKNVHFEKGTWRQYHDIYLAEELAGASCACSMPAANAVETPEAADTLAPSPTDSESAPELAPAMESEEPAAEAPEFEMPDPTAMNSPGATDPAIEALRQAEDAVTSLRSQPQQNVVRPAGFDASQQPGQPPQSATALPADDSPTPQAGTTSRIQHRNLQGGITPSAPTHPRKMVVKAAVPVDLPGSEADEQRFSGAVVESSLSD